MSASPSRQGGTGWAARAILWALIVLYIAFFGILTVQKHNAFETTAFDLGNVDQAVWNTRHGRPFAMTNIEGLTNRLGTHVEPILLPISLIYFVWSDPRALLLLQTIVIALGAWPVYLLARRALSHAQDPSPTTARRDVPPWPPNSHFMSQALPLLFAFVYLLFPALQSANVFDFHAVTLAPTFFLFALYCLETERWGGFVVFSVLTMSCKEDMPLMMAMLGLYAVVVRRRWLVGLVTMAVALAWFLVAVGWIMPHFDTQGVSPLSNRYAYLGDSPLEIVITLVTQPGVVLEHLLTAENLVYMRDLLTPVAFLSLLAPQVLMLAVPPLLVNLLSTDGFMHQLEGFHYGAPLVPAVVIAAAYSVAWLIRRLHNAVLTSRTDDSMSVRVSWLLAGVILAASLIYHYGHGYTPLAAGFRGSWPVVTDHHHLGEEMAHSIPADASLAALPYPNPHASQRQQLTMIDRVENGLPAPLHDASYVWLDVTNGWPLHPNDLKTGVEGLLASSYGVEQATDGWLLLRRGAPAKELPDAFYDFARTSDPQPQYPMQLQFLLDGEPVLECLGFDLVLEEPRSDAQSSLSALQFYWRALQPLPPGLRLYPFYLDDTTGQIIEDTTLRPMIATVWYPPERWQTGEIVVTRTLPWDVGSTYSVGLGVVQGDDWSNVDQRLPIRVESSDQVVRLFDDDTWARLLHVEAGEPIDESRLFAPPAPQHPLDADFGGQIRLLGSDLDYSRSRQDAAASCDLTLYWQAQTRMETSYTVFVQLLDPADKIRAQVDSVPQGGSYPTVWWLPGEIVVDTITLPLPPDTPCGEPNRLIAGLYDPDAGERLPVVGAGTDFVELLPVQD